MTKRFTLSCCKFSSVRNALLQSSFDVCTPYNKVGTANSVIFVAIKRDQVHDKVVDFCETQLPVQII